MRTGWQIKRFTENSYGRQFVRWYIKSPNGNFYKIYKNYMSDTIWMTMDVDNSDRAIKVGDNLGEAIQKLYNIESQGTYSSFLSDDIKNSRECKFLYNRRERVW